jgi:hypothetical protein
MGRRSIEQKREAEEIKEEVGSRGKEKTIP